MSQILINLFKMQKSNIIVYLNYSKISSGSDEVNISVPIPPEFGGINIYKFYKTVPIFYRISPISETIIIFTQTSLFVVE